MTDKIREEIAKLIMDWDYEQGEVWCDWESEEPEAETTRKAYRIIADQILSIKGIRIEAENQELPKLDPHDYCTGCPSCGEEVGTTSEVEMGMQILKDKDWVKCEKEEHESQS